jgi:hypothetical protein
LAQASHPGRSGGAGMGLDWDEIGRVREKLRALDIRSLTSQKFQDDLLRLAEGHVSAGDCLIEVGSFHGGLTAQLACAAKSLDTWLDVVELSEEMMERTRHAVEACGHPERVRYHCIGLEAFVRQAGASIKPALVFLDADHSYEAVKSDIRAVYELPNRPEIFAFHDYSLRYTGVWAEKIGVSRAINELLPADRLIEIGDKPGIHPDLRTTPQSDGHYHQEGEPEGVYIHCRAVRLKRQRLARLGRWVSRLTRA